MELSKKDRAILANQNNILALLDKANKKDYLYKAEIAERGYEGLYDELFSNLSTNPTTEEICEETMDILDMYNQINNLISQLQPKHKNLLDLKKIKFEGFDGNHDKHYHFMKFIVTKGELYEDYKGKNINSHTRGSLPKYKKMLEVYNENVNDSNNYILDLDGLKNVINAI